MGFCERCGSMLPCDSVRRLPITCLFAADPDADYSTPPHTPLRGPNSGSPGASPACATHSRDLHGAGQAQPSLAAQGARGRERRATPAARCQDPAVANCCPDTGGSFEHDRDGELRWSPGCDMVEDRRAPTWPAGHGAGVSAWRLGDHAHEQHAAPELPEHLVPVECLSTLSEFNQQLSVVSLERISYLCVRACWLRAHVNC